jgi:putative alpha-1,2-mannosidase
VKREGQAAWNKELSKVAVTMLDEGEMTNFYTAMYHAFLSPTVYMDVDLRYKGLDQNVHFASSPEVIRKSDARPAKPSPPFTNYTTFSLWDTYRALHPFLNINPADAQSRHDPLDDRALRSERAQDASVWSHYANENWCMIGYHSVRSSPTRS